MLAARPKTLPAAAAGVVTGTALAWRDGHFRPGPALAALCVALLLQIGSNLANDVYDYERGADAGERHGPLRVTQAGLLAPAQVKAGMWSVFGLAALLGLYLAWQAGWVVILIGLAAILSAIAYTAWWMSLPIGWLIVDILVVNNLRDITADRAAGKHTLAVRWGERGALLEYTTLLAASYLILPLLAVFRVLPWGSLLAWLSLPLAWRTLRAVLERRGRPLNAALAGTGQTTLLYSVLFFIGLALAR